MLLLTQVELMKIQQGLVTVILTIRLHILLLTQAESMKDGQMLIIMIQLHMLLATQAESIRTQQNIPNQTLLN